MTRSAALGFAVAVCMLPAVGSAQVPDSVRTERERIGCPSLEGRWSLIVVLDSSDLPAYPAGRSAKGEVQLGGDVATVPYNPDYPCRGSGRVILDYAALWGRTRHPYTDSIAAVPDEVMTRAFSSWMGPPGGEDSVMIQLGAGTGGLSLRGEVDDGGITGTWYLLTGHQYGSSRPVFADGHFVMRRKLP